MSQARSNYLPVKRLIVRQPVRFAFPYLNLLFVLWAASVSTADARDTVSDSGQVTLTEQKPNIVLILADDMGYGEPSHAGGIIPTPALDRMAQEGMRFTDAHTTSSVCTPTRYGILTGRYNWRSRLKSSVLFKATDRALMDPNRLNLPTFLQQAGYHTACIGKWHLGADFERLPSNSKPDEDKRDASWQVDYSQPFKNGPVDVGFDEAFFILASLDMAPYVYLRNNRAVTVPTVNKGFPHNEYNDYKRVGAAAEDFDASTCLADWARESRAYISRRAKDESAKPFFLYLPLTSPHTPITPGKAFKGKYKEFSWYADFMAETDWVVAEVLEELKESGLDDNTMVIFTSDNGFAPYVKIPKMFAAGYRPSATFRGAKATIYEGGHRVPFLVRWPGTVDAGTTSDVTICTTDFFATFAELLGRDDDGSATLTATIPDNAAEDSFSFAACLKGSKDPTRPFTIHHSISGAFAIRKGDWKLIMNRGAGGGWGLPGEKTKTTAKLVQLYNLKDDPGETKNLEESQGAVVGELVNELSGALHEGRTTPGEKQQNDGWPYRDNATKAKYPQLSEG
jgi:arylsulfatase A